jgi:hypothetical protein
MNNWEVCALFPENLDVMLKNWIGSSELGANSKKDEQDGYYGVDIKAADVGGLEQINKYLWEYNF